MGDWAAEKNVRHGDRPLYDVRTGAPRRSARTDATRPLEAAHPVTKAAHVLAASATRRAASRSLIDLVLAAAVGTLLPPTAFARDRVVQPAAKIVGFSGWVIPALGSHYEGSAVDQVVGALRAQGFNAEGHPPSDWREVADRLVSEGRPPGRMILIGNSRGAGAALMVAEQMAANGLRVDDLILIEAWTAERVPANVDRAVHYYTPGLFHNLIAPGFGFTGSLENIDLTPLMPGIETYSHTNMAYVPALQTFMIDQIVARATQTPPGARDKLMSMPRRRKTADQKASER